jgi:predicted MFS family arabinose efflux permease
MVSQDSVKNSTSVPKGNSIWTRSLVVLAVAVFLLSLGSGLQQGVSTNFIKELGVSGSQVLLLSGIREIPGLCLMFLAAMMMRLPLTWRAAASVLILGVGYGLFATVHSWTALIVVSVTASLGFHLWMPLNSSLALGLVRKEDSGKTLGTMAAVAALATMAGIGSILLFSKVFTLRAFTGIAGILIILAAVVLSRLPKNIGETKKPQPRLLFRRRYWLYYVLLLFEGSRAQVFSAFNLMVLVYDYGLTALQVSALLLVSGFVNFVFARPLGHLLDRFGERTTLATGYVALALCFVGYALVSNVLVLTALVVFINLLVTLSMGLSTYVNRIAPAEELTPTLSTGVSVNHISSVGMSFVAGALLPIVGYRALSWGAVVIVSLSVPFALAMRTQLQKRQKDVPMGTAAPR